MVVSSLLGSEKVNTLRSKLSKLVLLIIDEVSMVGADMLFEVHKRLQQIKGVPSDVMFGRVSVLAVGDLYQLPPVAQSTLFSTFRDSYAQLYKSGSIWQDEFELMELDEIMRQRGDSAFAELLCRVRTASYAEGGATEAYGSRAVCHSVCLSVRTHISSLAEN